MFDQQKKPALVLDLDETVIRSTQMKTHNSLHKIVINRRPVFFQERPGFKKFFELISQYYDLYIFTSSKKEYTDRIIAKIAPSIPENHRYYGDSITQCDGVCIKDLSILGKPLNQVILVDNSGSSGLYQPDNVVIISSWFGEPTDNVLLNELVPVLITAVSDQNIQAGLKYALMKHKPMNLSALT